jgi:hypothetical protein
LSLVGFAACGGGDATETNEAGRFAMPRAPAPVAVPPNYAIVPPQQQSPVVIGGSGTGIHLAWTGISALHKGFFTAEALVSTLSADLTGVVQSPATVHVQFDADRHLGHIQLVLRAGSLSSAVGSGLDWVRMQDLAPITRALARYRSGVAGRFDLRIDSFRIGVVSGHTETECIFGVEGQPPPDGSMVSPCVIIDGTQRCGIPSKDAVSFEPADVQRIMRCLQ